MKKLLDKIKPILDKAKPILNKIANFYKKIGDVATPTLILAAICIVVTLALSSANALTHKKIENLAIENQNKAMAKLIEADEYQEKNFLDKWSCHIAIKDGENVGYIFTVAAKGYGGDINVMTAINLDGTVAAVAILDASGETPGLGQNVTKENFYTQFSGLKDSVTVIKGGGANSQNNEINAVTGATISSKAVTEAVNIALDRAEGFIGSETEYVIEHTEETENSNGEELK